jgi:hypothetical protein
MSISKIEIKLGEITFSGEGESKWLSEQLDKILDRAEKLVALAPKASAASLPADNPAAGNTLHVAADLSGHNEISSKPLPVWLKSVNADSVQNSKFLATAIWCEAKGEARLKTKDIGLALSNAGQRKLNNASECFNQNLKKGFCEKDGDKFYVTEEGKNHLGIS